MQLLSKSYREGKDADDQEENKEYHHDNRYDGPLVVFPNDKLTRFERGGDPQERGRRSTARGEKRRETSEWGKKPRKGPQQTLVEGGKGFHWAHLFPPQRASFCVLLLSVILSPTQASPVKMEMV